MSILVDIFIKFDALDYNILIIVFTFTPYLLVFNERGFRWMEVQPLWFTKIFNVEVNENSLSSPTKLLTFISYAYIKYPF